MLRRTLFGFCSLNEQLQLFKRKPVSIPIFDDIIKILRPFDIRVNLEDMLETVKILGKYSQHNLYKIPFFLSRDPAAAEELCSRVRQCIRDEVHMFCSSQIPSYPRKLSIFFGWYSYEQQMMLPKFIHSLARCHGRQALESEKLIRLATCLENIQIALSLHHMIGQPRDKKSSIFSLSRFLQSKMSDKKLVLGGDYFHSKASVLSTKILDRVEAPLYLSIVEEEAAKAVFYEHQLLESISTLGPQSIEIEHVYQLAYHKFASKFSFSGLLAHMIMNEKNCEQTAEDAFKACLYLGLCLAFQEETKRFIRQLPLLTNQHLMSIMGNKEPNFYQDQISLPLYFIQQKSKETTVLQQLNDHTLRESERVIQTMKEKSREHFQRIGADFSFASDLVDHFRLFG